MLMVLGLLIWSFVLLYVGWMVVQFWVKNEKRRAKLGFSALLRETSEDPQRRKEIKAILILRERLKELWDTRPLWFGDSKTHHDKIFAIEDALEEIKYLEEIDNIYFSLTDFMHDARVFELFTNEEICDIFTKARMLSQYNKRRRSVQQIRKFEIDVLQPSMERLYGKDYNQLKDKK